MLDVCQVKIGDFTLFGPAVQIYTATHPMNAELRRKQEFAKPIEIGSDVWVGGGAIICPGVKIGSKTVIGAGSVSRRLDDGKTLEVLRVCTDGTPNANSFLYGRVKRIAVLMGYARVITFTLEEESGASLKAVKARIVGEVRPQEWNVPSRLRKSQAVYGKAS